MTKREIMDKKLFGDVPFGTRFSFYGKTYTKIALNMAEDKKHHGHIFARTSVHEEVTTQSLVPVILP